VNSVRATTLPIFILILLIMAAAPPASAEPNQIHVQWNIASVPCSGPNSSYPCTLLPDGSATAMAQDCSIPPTPPATTPPFGCTTITLTGAGTFTILENGGPSNKVTGGGTWKVVAADGTVTSGTYVVTELVLWAKAEPLALPECGTCETTDNIGELHEATGGVAILLVAYSDGTRGVLEFGCAGLPDPPPVSEGITATKSILINNFAAPGLNIPPLPSNFPIKKVLVPVMFWNPGFFQYFVEFHVQDPDDYRH
jgi:hypothetical protein